jgi:hypothetical protein
LTAVLRRCVFAVVLAALSGCKERVSEPGPRASTASASASAAPSAPVVTQRELDEIVAFVQKSQEEGIGGRDPEAFMRIWATDARIVSGRTETPDAYDVAFEYASLRPTALARSRGRQDVALLLRYEAVGAEAVADEVRLIWVLTVAWGAHGERGSDQSMERYRLRRGREGGWRVFENRVWPLGQATPQGAFRFDEAYWKAREAELAEAQRGRDVFATARALAAAWHFREAYQAIQAFTRAHPKDAAGWTLQARLADRLRLIDDTLAAYRQLTALDPKTPVPGWVEAHPAWKRAP